MTFVFLFVFFFKQKTAYEMRISDWSSDVCSSDLHDDCGSALSWRSHHRVPPFAFLRPNRVVSAPPPRILPGSAISANCQPCRFLFSLAELVDTPPGQHGQDRKSTRLNSSH